jgi:hypothetical protein
LRRLAQRLPDRAPQPLRRERLLQQLAQPRAPIGGDDLEVGVARDLQHLELRTPDARHERQVEAVKARHDDVGQQQIERLPVSLF